MVEWTWARNSTKVKIMFVLISLNNRKGSHSLLIVFHLKQPQQIYGQFYNAEDIQPLLKLSSTYVIGRELSEFIVLCFLEWAEMRYFQIYKISMQCTLGSKKWTNTGWHNIWLITLMEMGWKQWGCLPGTVDMCPACRQTDSMTFLGGPL